MSTSTESGRTTRTESSRTTVAGYAVGVGLVFIPLIGIPLRFMYQGLPPVLLYAGAFLLGVTAGLLVAATRGRRRGG